MGGEGAPTQPQGERARHHIRQRDWHKGACGGRGGAPWAVALTGHGAMGLDSPRGAHGPARGGEGWPHPAPLAVLPGLSMLLPSGPGQTRPGPTQEGAGRGPRGQARPVYHSPQLPFCGP